MACKRRVGPRESECQPSDALAKGEMHFFKIMLDYAIQEKKMMIPPKFARKYGDQLSAVATLSVADDLVWPVGLTKAENNIFFHVGWHEFVEYYSIREGYFLIFSYKGTSNFHVLIFDMTACEINYPFNSPSREHEPNHDKQYPVLNEDEMEDDDSIEILGFTAPSVKRVFNNCSRKQAMNKRYNSSSKQDFPRSTASVDSSKNGNGNGNETRSKKCKVEDWVEIMALESVNESSQGKIRKGQMSISHGSSLDKTKGNNKHPNKKLENLQAPVHDLGIRMNQKKIKIIRSCGDIHVRFKEGGRTKTAAEVGSANKKTKPCEHQLSTKSKDDVEIIVSKGFFSRYTMTSKERLRAIHAAKLFKPKNPSFLVILAPYNISASFNMYVPAAFARKYLSRDSEYLTLQDSDGRQWPVLIKLRYKGGLDLQKGWNEFSRANNLKERDVCIFELIKTNDVVLKVSIFHVSNNLPECFGW